MFTDQSLDLLAKVGIPSVLTEGPSVRQSFCWRVTNNGKPDGLSTEGSIQVFWGFFCPSLTGKYGLMKLREAFMAFAILIEKKRFKARKNRPHRTDGQSFLTRQALFAFGIYVSKGD